MRVQRFGSMLGVMVATVTLTGLASGQEAEPPSQYERVKELAPLRGFWVTEEGPQGRFSMTSKWTSNRSYMQMEFTTRKEDKRTHRGMVNIGWNAADKKLTSWSFWPDSQAKGEVTIDGNTVHIKPVGLTEDGKQTSADVSMKVDGDTLTVQIRNSKRGEEDEPDMDFTFQRRERRRGQRGQRTGN